MGFRLLPVGLCGRLALVLFVSLGPALLAATSAQTPPGQAAPGAPSEPAVDPERMTPREVQRLFDAYVAMQAQERLQLTEAQFPQFLPRLKALLDLRRTNLAGRQRLLAELGRAAGDRTLDDGALRAKLSQLRAFDEQSAATLRTAYEGIDQILDPRQQARFRVFEDQIERRKVELLMRARQNSRARALRNQQP